MADLSDRDVEDIIGGQQPVGRDDFATVVELTNWMHASRDLEPAPPMNDGLFWQVDEGMQASMRSSRRPPAHLRGGSRHRPSWPRLVGGQPDGAGGVSLRPALSLAAAAVLLFALLTAVYYGGSGRQPSTVASPPAAGATPRGSGSSVTTAAPVSTSTASTEITTTSTTSTSTTGAPSTASGPASTTPPPASAAPSVNTPTSITAPPPVDDAPSTDPEATDKAPGQGDSPVSPTDPRDDDGDGDRRSVGDGYDDDSHGSDDPEGSAEWPWWTPDDLPWWPLMAGQSNELDTLDQSGEATEDDGSRNDRRRDDAGSIEEPNAG
jgi:hypothetical protein